MKKLILITALFPMTAALAWDGIEPSSGTKIEITSRLSKVKKGNTVEIFDHGKNEYHEIEIDRISSHGLIRSAPGPFVFRTGNPAGFPLPRFPRQPIPESRFPDSLAVRHLTGRKPENGVPLPGCSKTAKIFIMWRTLVIPVSVRPAYPFFRHGQQNRSHSKGNHDHHYRHHHT